MKKTIFMLSLLLIFSLIALSAQDFSESVAGSIKVTKEKVGVLLVDPQSYLYPLSWALRPAKTITAPDTLITLGIKAEIIRKGGTVMVMNPPGMEKIISPFVVMNKGQADILEDMAANAPTLISKINTLTPEGLNLLQKFNDVTEFSSEKFRIDQFAAAYRKILELWGITKLITIESTGKASYIVRGYEIVDVSSSLVFQYYLKSDMSLMAANLSTAVKSNRVTENGYIFVDSEKVKPDDSNIRIYEVVKRISEFLK